MTELAGFSTEWLVHELNKRHGTSSTTQQSRPECGSSGVRGSYDTALHVFALGLILVLSTLSCGFPLFSTLTRSRTNSQRQKTIIFYCQHFGTGVLIATAFVHLLPTAFQSLTDPCLPYFFSQGYTPLPGLVAMTSALVVVGLESYLTTRGAAHSHSHWHDGDDGDGEEEHTSNGHSGYDGQQSRQTAQGNGFASRRGTTRPTDIRLDHEDDGLISGASPLPTSTPTVLINGKQRVSQDTSDELDQDSDLELNLDELEPATSSSSHTPSTNSPPHPAAPSRKMSIVTPHTPEEQKRLTLQCLLLEAGILFHSIFIGMALSVATGPAFIVFLIAIAFHQTFEGLALGSRIAALQMPRRSPRPWLMVLAYGMTTPLGQAIGLGVHGFYDPQSQTGLLMVGFMNAVSSGLLLFAGLVQLLAEDFLSEKSYEVLKGRKRLHAFMAVVGGASLMAVVGAFA